MTLRFKVPPAHQPVRPTRDYLSYSAISTYRSCPLRYYFRYVAGLPEATVSASLVFGAAIHRALEYHFRELFADNAPPTLANLMCHYHAAWQARDRTQIHYGAEGRPALDALARRMLDAFSQHPRARPTGAIVAVEEEVRGSLIAGAPDLLGRIDLITETREELIIHDWKTSRSAWNDDQVREASEQLVLYSELARDFAPRKQVRIEFLVLTKTKEVAIGQHGLVVSPAQVNRTKRLVERVWKAIDGEHFYPAPSPIHCSGCPFQDPCRRWPAP